MVITGVDSDMDSGGHHSGTHRFGNHTAAEHSGNTVGGERTGRPVAAHKPLDGHKPSAMEQLPPVEPGGTYKDGVRNNHSQVRVHTHHPCKQLFWWHSLS